MNSEQQYIDLFTACRGLIDSHSAGALNALRDKAFDDFCRQGFPSQKVERYKYTDVASAFAPDYGMNLKRLEFAVNPYKAFRCDVPNLSTSFYFVVNDAFCRENSAASMLPGGVIVCSLKTAAEEHADLVASYYGKLARTEKDTLNALNTMLAQDGLFIYIPRGVDVERPIQVVNLLRADTDLMANRRVLVIMEEDARARLLFCDHAMDDRNFLTTQIMEVYAGERARLDFYELEETHAKNRLFSNLYADLQRDSTANLYRITLQGGLTRQRTDIALSGERAEVGLYGCVIADKAQHVDHNTLIDNRAEYGVSHQLYKYVMDGESTGAFAGRILVREGAQHTVSDERTANLCGSEARVYAQPMLEIYADDVKCSHGATVGQMDEQALFYMRQRGINPDEARLLLKLAFAGEVIDTIGLETLRNRLHHLVEKRFRGGMARCSECRFCS
ncbi:MAG: Fe-S cluster assembly protein SufD [Paraprevotella sp.]|nr:Fe-S cluster assembly protein SufD [Paraprevotella sp.]